jgi:nucleoside-diphosphate-sugar epimerase
MRILVLGGAGYIGSKLIPSLLDRGYDVEVIDLLWFGNNLPETVKIQNRDIFSLNEEDLKRFDQVIFLAGLSNDPMAEYSPAENFIYNSSAPAYLAYIAKRAGVERYIYASSCSVYGYTVNELYDEESPAISEYPYGISKLQGEQSVIKMADKKFSVIALRQGTVSGYSPRMRLDLVVNTMFKFAINKKEITVNNPSIWRPVLSIDDAVNAYIRSIESHRDISGVFNVASANYTVGEIGDLVKSGLKKYLDVDISIRIKNMRDLRNYKVSIEKAKRVLSFHPLHDIESIIRDLVNNMEKFKDFDNQNYYNIQVLKGLKTSDSK